MSSNEKMMLPDYDGIVVKAIREMEIKFKNYGNDWLKLDDKYWKERLSKEIKEYVDSMTIDAEKRKLLNILNMVCMAYVNANNVRASAHVPIKCPNCGESLVRHMVVDGHFSCEVLS